MGGRDAEMTFGIGTISLHRAVQRHRIEQFLVGPDTSKFLILGHFHRMRLLLGSHAVIQFIAGL